MKMLDSCTTVLPSPAFAPTDPMQALVLFAQLQQQQQCEIATLTDKLRLISSRPRFSIVDEVSASQATSQVVSTPATTTTTAAPPATLSAALSLPLPLLPA